MERINTIPGFDNLDQEETFARLEEAVLKATTLNFAIEFDHEKASAAVDLNEETLQEYLTTTRAPKDSTRWINIFAPDQQPLFVQKIAEYYKFSPRLTGIMRAKQHTPRPVGSISTTSRPFANGQPRTNRRSRKSTESPSIDLEMHHIGASSTSEAQVLDLSHYKLVNEVWHYCSVDWAPQHLCIGYNSLPNIARSPEESLEDNERRNKVENVHVKHKAKPTRHPVGKRLWNWLVICDDGTVISISEDPFPDSRDNWSQHERMAFKTIRRNLLTVVMQLSNVKNEWRKNNPIQTLDIRPGMQSNLNSKVTLHDSAGLLFYYLFDDWYTTYALVAKKEQQYAARLEDLRNQMFGRPDIDMIQSLHQTGRQLAMLKRMYQGYALIIKRILEKQKPFAELTPRQRRETPTAVGPLEFGGNTTSPGMDKSLNLDGHISSTSESLGAPLSQEAVVRFERLLDRINLYALSEIQECLDEKDALVFLNFNLITLKESYAIEKLTRITIILAKATILFLPVSLMTAYFSTQIEDLQGIYTATTYWVCFAIIVSISFVFLFGFGWISDTLEGKVIYRSTTRTLFEAGKQAYRLSSLGKKRPE